MKKNSKEIWVSVPGYEGHYEVSNQGNVKSLDRTVLTKNGERFYKGKIMNKNININKGYMYVDFSKNGKRERFRIHQLIAVCFLNHTPDGYTLVVDHIDGDKFNNRVENLQIVTQRQNLSTCYRAKEDTFTSEFVGVNYYKQTNRWRASIYYNEIQIHLGYYNNEEGASNAYQKALAKINDGTFNPEDYKPKWTSKFKGITFHKASQKYIARATIRGERIYLGRFENEEEAFQMILLYESAQPIKKL